MKNSRLRFSVLVFLVLPFWAFTQQDSTYWYNHQGIPQQVYHQSDVFAFRLVAGTMGGDVLPSPVVRKIYTRLEDPDHLTIVEFAPGFQAEDYEEVRTLIRSHPAYECSFDVVNPRPSESSTLGHWSPVDDVLLVTFRDPAIDSTEIAAFEQRHSIQLHQAPYPGLASGFSHCHLFKVPQPYVCEDGNHTIDVCRRIWEADSATVMMVEPNLVMAFRPESNDPKYVEQWYIENTGQGPLANGNPAGLYNADHDINWIWGLGFKGQGMRIAVIDFDGFDLQHEDMMGAFVSPWDAINGQPLPVGNQIGELRAHGMCVAGVIGARSENQLGLAGVAPECEIVPIQVNGSTAVIVMGIQKAQEVGLDVDVINLSFGSEIAFSSMQYELQIAKQAGRNGKGIVVVAGAGNDDMDVPFYPAAFPEVIGVIASTPDDTRKRKNGMWLGGLTDWGSNYGSMYDVAAGGVLIPSTDHAGMDGYMRSPGPSGGYVRSFDGTSAATPVVSAVCALLLQANPNMLDNGNGNWEVRDAIRNGAEKVYPNVYDYSAYPLEPGRSLEMGFGRLNAMNSLNLVSVPKSVEPGEIAVYMDADGARLYVHWEGSPLPADAEIAVHDVMGRQLAAQPCRIEGQRISMGMPALSAGIYIVEVRSAQRKFSKSARFLHY